MLKKPITYTDYNGVTKTENFYFNLSKAELLEMETGTIGTFTATVGKIIEAKDQPELVKLFKKLILKAYGEKTPDGRFEKSDEITKKFVSSAAYSELYMELATNDKAAAEFVTKIMPSDLQEKAAELAAQQKGITD